MILAALIGIVAATVAAAAAFSWRDREKAVRALLWLGAIAPFLIAPPKSVQEAPNVGALDVVRGVAPAAALAFSFVLMPRAARALRLGVTEFALGAFAVVTLLSSAWSVDPRSTFLKAVVLVASFACLARVVLLQRTADAAVRATAGISYLLVLAAAAEFFVLHRDAYAPLGYGPAAPLRLSSVYPQMGPDVLAWVCGFAALALVLRVGPAWAVHGWRRWALLAVVMSEAYLTRTRLAVAIWLVVLVVVVAVMSGYRRPIRPVLAVSSGILALAYVFSHQAQVASFVMRGQSAEAITSLTGRTILWQAATRAWQQNPWVGYGYYSGHRFLLAETSTLAAQVQDIDNTWLETLVDVGIIGEACLAVFVLAGLVRALRGELPPDTRLFCVAATLAMVGSSFVNPTIQSVEGISILAVPVLLASARCSARRVAVTAISPGSGRSSRYSPRRLSHIATSP